MIPHRVAPLAVDIGGVVLDDILHNIQNVFRISRDSLIKPREPYGLSTLTKVGRTDSFTE